MQQRSDTRLSQAETLRYSRHLILPEVGVEGQTKLRAARVALVGVGGLGSPAALYLAAAGVGTLGLIDFDTVDASNLQRQILHRTSTIGRPKLESAAEHINDINPHTQVECFETRLTSDNALEVLRDFDLVIDGSDNFPTRYLVNDACVLLDKPNVYGSVFRFEGQASVFHAARGPCYRCLFREPPPPGLVPSCAEAGVLGVLPGIIGSIQALETIKLLLDAGESLIGRLLLLDALTLNIRELKLRKDPECPVCGPDPSITGLIDYEVFCGEATDHFGEDEIAASDLSTALQQGQEIMILDVREPHEWDICRIPNSTLIPLGDLPESLDEVAGHRQIVTVCHTGIRSLRAMEILRSAGHGEVRSLLGGIDAWSREVDPSIPRY